MIKGVFLLKSTGSGNASGKIILMGEHAVVHGEPAIALPFLATKITAVIKSAPVNEIDSHYFVGPLTEVPTPLMNIQHLVEMLQQRFNDDFQVKLTIESTIPAERGMGSSAATAVAITRAFFDFHEEILSEAELLSFVNLSEKIAHGNPSGIDAAATSGPNPLYFIKGKELRSFPMNLNAYLIVADTGIKGKTRAAVTDVAQLYREDATIAKEIAYLGDLTRAARTAIIENNAREMGSLMMKAHRTLKKLTVSNETLDHLADTAIANGALGAKLTGGGRGGCLIALAPDLATAKKITATQEQAGAIRTWIQGLGVFAK